MKYFIPFINFRAFKHQKMERNYTLNDFFQQHINYFVIL